ncbi:hypothetical protein AZL_022080 [Azospirillum sp. B510]|uniref:phage head-tail joining protein n=1 Tax=Azospirillum sp. (strain B510) TaxID=137722 RepID=UPI0001C4BEFD|nr:hypothetical protein [Azospirillum sp. B510]BAI72846.1 hypothetical protein AZL_022080 [Azospirillum sp. B510]
MATLAEMQAMKTALETARFSGNRRVKTGQTEIEFKSDAEMQSALAALDRQIAAQSNPRSSVIYVSPSKGV